MDPLHATLEEFAADGYTHVEPNCPRCRMIRLRGIDQHPKISMGLTLDALARRLRCAECGGMLPSVKPRGSSCKTRRETARSNKKDDGQNKLIGTAGYATVEEAKAAKHAAPECKEGKNKKK